MKLVPLLLMPKALALKHRFFEKRETHSYILRDGLMIFFAAVVMYAVYAGTAKALRMLLEYEQLAYLSPSIPFSILFLMLFMMLLISNAITSLGAFFLARDMELILSAPFNRFRFFIEKLFSIMALTSWMPLVFLLPFFYAYAEAYEAEASYYLFVALGLPPYFLITALIAVSIITLFTALVPARKTKGIFILFLVMFLALIYGMVELISYSVENREDVTAILNILTVISFPDQLWLPSHWFAISLREVLEGRVGAAWLPMGLMYVTTFALAGLTYMIHGVFFETAYSKSCNNQHQPLFGKSWSAAMTQRVFQWLPKEGRGFLLKEYRSLIRDMPQLVQLLLLIGICSLYLYNLRVFRMVNNLPVEQQTAWLAFLFIANSSMSAFVTTAASTRLVFPSISHEGQGFWMLRSSSLSIKEIMNWKLKVWFPPIALLSSFVYVLGALVIHASPLYIVVALVSGIIVSFTIVTLGVGLGGVFADFSWEHTGQLVASFGSLIFMLSSIGVIAIQMLAIGVALFVRQPGMAGHGMADGPYFFLVALLIFVLLLSVVLTKRIAFTLGEKALLSKG